jgi:hypothetical protein
VNKDILTKIEKYASTRSPVYYTDEEKEIVDMCVEKGLMPMEILKLGVLPGRTYGSIQQAIIRSKQRIRDANKTKEK